jgi:hypothetical protein
VKIIRTPVAIHADYNLLKSISINGEMTLETPRAYANQKNNIKSVIIKLILSVYKLMIGLSFYYDIFVSEN